MALYIPPDCTEREPDGTWEDCTWCSGVCLGNAAHGRTIYAPTQKVYESLRRASGDTMVGGSNLRDLSKGMRALWGWTGTLLVKPTWQIVLDALKPGFGFVVQGNMGSVPANLRRWDPNFGLNGRFASHAVYVERVDTTDRVWWMNPEAPKGYPGEFITITDLRRFFSGLPGAEVMFVKVAGRASPLPDTSTGDPDVYTTIEKLPFGGTFTIPAGKSVTGLLFNPATGKVEKEKVWPARATPSSASYDANMGTTVMRGNPFIRANSGFFAPEGNLFYYISVGSGIIAVPNPAPIVTGTDCTPAANTAVLKALQHIAPAVKALATAIDEVTPR